VNRKMKVDEMVKNEIGEILNEDKKGGVSNLSK
jgi:hypothetical protein